ncbi:MAG: hypothetical protein KC416_17740, partial [Myxococcales bacterium]|nr:hypothetical protein [Myxococcales bacterium]
MRSRFLILIAASGLYAAGCGNQEAAPGLPYWYVQTDGGKADLLESDPSAMGTPCDAGPCDDGEGSGGKGDDDPGESPSEPRAPESDSGTPHEGDSGTPHEGDSGTP